MKRGDFIYVPQNTRIKYEHNPKKREHRVRDLSMRKSATHKTSEPMRGIWLEEAGKTSKIFLSGDVVYVKTCDISIWREDVGSSEVGEGFKPKFFVEEGVY